MNPSQNDETKFKDWRLVLARYLASTPRIHAFGIAIVLGLSPVIVAINLWQPSKSTISITDGPSMDHASAVTLVNSLSTWSGQLESQDQRYQRLLQKHEELLAWAPKSLSPIDVIQAVEHSLNDRNLQLESTNDPIETATDDWTFWETQIQLTGDYHDLCHWLDHWRDAAIPAEAVTISVRPADLELKDVEKIFAEITLRFPTKNSNPQRLNETDSDEQPSDSTDAYLEPMT